MRHVFALVSLLLMAAVQPLCADQMRMRGANVDQDCTEKDLRDLRALGANQVRWHLSWRYFKEDIKKYGNRAVYDAWLDSAVSNAEKAAQICETLGMLMLVDLASPPGDRVEGGWTSGIFVNSGDAERLMQAWELIARRLEKYRAIYAFEIVNEPVLPEGMDESAWRELFLKTVKRIRAIDPDRAVVYDVMPWDNASAYVGLKPLPMDGVIYTLHMYMPEKLTGQYAPGSLPYAYPGNIPVGYWEYEALGAAENNGNPKGYGDWLKEKPVRFWDKQTLRQILKPVLDFQRRYGASVYVGEFSCTRWAPEDSAYRYMRDCIELFDEYGWDWSYHIWRSSDVWDAEIGTVKGDLRRGEAPTDRVLLLQSAFGNNEHLIFPSSP
jgi:endoglucanase